MIGERLGNFEIIEEVGRGGMGVVYRARQVSLDRIVALKVLPANRIADDTAAQRFEREAHAMAQLQHPNIVDVIEVGEEDDLQYFAMKYVEGRSLEEIIREEGPLDPERAAKIAAQVAEALHHAHERGVVHRDIKPGNILIAEDGRAVVTDFGIAKAIEGLTLGAGQSLTQGVIGTPEYMSPEVIRGNPVDGRTDLYSLAVVIYQMLTGRVPFTATTPYQVAEMHLEANPTPLTAIAVNCPAWLESIVLRAMMKEPSQRFGSAAEMAKALQTHTAVDVPQPTSYHATPQPQQTGPNQQSAQQAPVAQSDGRTPVPPWIWALGVAGVLLLAFAVVMMMRQSTPLNRMGGTADDEAPTNEETELLPPPPPPQSVTITVPDVRGLDFDEACNELSNCGLGYVRFENQREDGTEENEVISQDPSAGRSVDKGTEVRLTVSLGPPSKATVPDVTGLSTARAERELRSLGFSIDYRGREHSDRYSTDMVMFQSPGAGFEASPGSTVYLTVSKGPEPEPDHEERILGTWQRTHQDGKPSGTGRFTFRNDGTAIYKESGHSPESHRWDLYYDGGRPVLRFASTGNSYYIETLTTTTMKWRTKKSSQDIHTTSFRRR